MTEIRSILYTPSDYKIKASKAEYQQNLVEMVLELTEKAYIFTEKQSLERQFKLNQFNILLVDLTELINRSHYSQALEIISVKIPDLLKDIAQIESFQDVQTCLDNLTNSLKL